MRVTMNIDCTPEEARSFFGAPDVKPLQEALMQKMQQNFLGTMQAMDPADAMRQWQSMSLQGFQEFQKLFWAAAGVPPLPPPRDEQSKVG